jgi:hypothetical protein
MLHNFIYTKLLDNETFLYLYYIDIIYIIDNKNRN